jgi:hypothetical protein
MRLLSSRLGESRFDLEVSPAASSMHAWWPRSTQDVGSGKVVGPILYYEPLFRRVDLFTISGRLALIRCKPHAICNQGKWHA